MGEDGDEGQQRVGDLDQGLALDLKVGRNDRGAGLRLPERRWVFLLEKSNLAAFGFLQGARGMNDEIAVADDVAANQGRQLPNGDGHEMILSSMKDVEVGEMIMDWSG